MELIERKLVVYSGGFIKYPAKKYSWLLKALFAVAVIQRISFELPNIGGSGRYFLVHC